MKPILLLIPILALCVVGDASAQFIEPPHDSSNDIICLACHVFHAPPAETPGYKTLQEALNLCGSCHNPLGVAPVATHAPGGAEVACNTCHDPHIQEQKRAHGSTFSKLIRTQVATPNSGDVDVILMGPTGPKSFADGDTVYDGICEACHTATSYHRNNPAGNHAHNAAADCRQCHPHEAGFQPIGGSCLDCHNQAQPPGQGYRRQVVEQGGSGGDFLRYSHHVDNGSGQQIVSEADCTTCHDQGSHRNHPDPHVLLKDPDGGASHLFNGSALSLTDFCLGCHDANAMGGNPTPFSSGRTPADIDARWSANPAHAATPVGVECWTCHQNGHGSDNPALNTALEEQLCSSCHDGSPAAVNVAAEFNKTYKHPIAGQSFVHELGEDPLSMPRHVECEDCHNSHAADGSIVNPAPQIPGTQLGVSGINTFGNLVAEAALGFEVCYKCHADTTPASSPFPRMVQETNVRLEFDPGQPSFHPIEAPGKNPDVPSLIGGWTKNSVMTCQDCHAGNSGVAGPHGSNQPWILKKRYDTDFPNPETVQAYALCYECHDRDSILDDDSFSKHKRHIDNVETPCSVCHDAHGSRDQGPHEGTHLVNFRTDVVFPNKDGDLWFKDNGQFEGSCALQCHGKNHKAANY